MKFLDKLKAAFFRSHRLSNVEFSGAALPLFREAMVTYLGARTLGAVIVDDDEIALRGADGMICVIKFSDPRVMDDVLSAMSGKPNAKA